MDDKKQLDVVKEYFDNNPEKLSELLEQTNIDVDAQHNSRLQQVQDSFNRWYKNNKK